ncbi:B3 domain-containing protein At5g38490-like [Solanum dulcamara]|uniref:B3 domain-containing protein At5g38490-like n=1 Tax=Solanum dulcamara TaxID=45834 RepID=UPI002484FAC3|nr:B3 domain-containing protein At5g38490-like [Solanum dulcamara]
MVYTMLSLDDFSGKKSNSNMTPLDYLLDVTKVASLKYEQEKRITHNIHSILPSFPQVVDHQEKTILDLVVPTRKRSIPRKVTEQSFCNGDESMIKKAVENNSDDQEHRVIKINWNIGVSNQEFIRLQKNTTDDRGNRKRLANDTTLLGLDNQEQKKIKRNITVRAESPAPAPTPIVMIDRELDIEFKNLITFIGGSLESVKLVIEKRLFKTDVKPAEGRLSIPQKQMSNTFLEPEEDARLNTRNGSKMCEMKVMLIEPSRRVSEINLRKWFMNKDNGKTSLSYVLVTYWNEVARRNDLKVGTKVQLWAFRKGTDLCFALVKLQD